MQYELLYLVGERKEADLETIKSVVDAILTEEGAKLGEELIMKRKLAYEIKHERRGTYVARRFELPEYDMWADGDDANHEKGIKNITRKMNLNNDVLRSIVVKTDDIPELSSLEAAQQEQKKQQQQQRRQDTRRQDDKRQPKQQSKEVVRQKEQKEIEKEEVKEEKTALIEDQRKAEKKEKVEEKSIDKQLEEILNI